MVLARLKEGAIIWMDMEQPSGKVYGYNRVEVVSVTSHADHVEVRFNGPRIKGTFTVSKKEKGWHQAHLCTNPFLLKSLVESNPLATEPGTLGTISGKSRRYLKKVAQK